MGAYTFEILLAVVLALLVLWVRHKQEPNRPLRPAEIERYLDTIASRFPFPDDMDKTATLARLRRFGEEDDGRDLYMTNLLRYHDRMASGPAPAARFTGTRDEANKIYEDNSLPILMRSGAFVVFGGTVRGRNAIGGNDPADDAWSRVLIVHYPSRRHFFDLLTNDRYLSKADFKTYAMYIALVPTTRDVVVPDFRQLAIAGASIVFFAAAWLHAVLG